MIAGSEIENPSEFFAGKPYTDLRNLLKNFRLIKQSEDSIKLEDYVRS